MSSNLLDKLNSRVQEEILKQKALVDEARESAGYTPFGEYFVNKLREKIVEANGDIAGIDGIDVEFIDREQFGADVAVKIPTLLKEKGSSTYIKEIIPKIIANSQKLVGSNDFIEIQHKGIYVNILLSNKYLFENVWQAVKMGGQFGRSDVFKKRSSVVDYSSPNVAKHLHAGHIRSTIIGEVLCNIYEAVGYTVHRLNYINDWGGMGFLIEGYERWNKKISDVKSKNDQLYNIYQIYRRGEKLLASEEEFNKLTPEAADELADYYGVSGSFTEFKEKFEEFKSAADRRFKNLEAGEALEFDLWLKMREWSLEEFDIFYKMIEVKHDYTIGESFYAKRALDLVNDRLSTGEVVLFTEKLAEEEIAFLKSLELTEARFNQLADEIRDDVGACVVMLSNHKRLLVRKSNGATLYAVRDLAGIEHRVETFRPARLVYETAEEQAEYFNNMFEAAGVLNLDHNRSIGLSHLFHGLYIDAATGKKLASREGAESVENLISESIKHFKSRYDMPDKDAHLMAVGSITFNDIKQDKRFPIALDRDVAKSIRGFEESGGAYIMYSLARARSIIRKSEANPADLLVGTEDLGDLTEEEVSLMKKVAQLPLVILRSALDDSPSTLANYLSVLAALYNGYYEKAPVLEGGKLLYPHRLLITAAVVQVLSNGLKICHAESPEVI